VQRPIRFATFLAPNIYPVYECITRRVKERLAYPVELVVGTDYEDLVQADVAFVCGLAYVLLRRRGKAAVEPLAAPVLQGPRYGGRPIYFSDVIVRRDSPYRSFADLRGRSWAYNEPCSQSGYGIIRHRLIELGETSGYFGKVVETGWHEQSIRLVCCGEVDASAIDAQVLAVALRDRPELMSRLRVIDSLGPSTIQPVVAACGLSEQLRADILGALLAMHEDADVRGSLAQGFVERFVAVGDSDYNDIRAMQMAAETSGFLTLR
jgi:phosphonate transport system substrate-binding protein